MTGERTGPEYPEIGIVALVTDPWGERWQTRHQLLTRLARYFHVVWVNPAHEWREIPEALRTRHALAGRQVADEPGFQVYVPEWWLPRLARFERLASWSLAQRLKRAHARLVRAGCRETVLHIWNPEFAAAAGSSLFDLQCYHVDDEYSFSRTESPLDAREVRLLERAGQVFMVSRSLIDKKGRFNPHTELLPNGVNFRLFSEPVEEPADLAAIPHPRVGFSGYLTRHLDWTLLEWLARTRPDLQFVLAGAQKARVEVAEAVSRMSSLPNVHFLGAKPSWELAHYPQHFDVCMMPYVISASTNHSCPLKLHEYLACGRPALGSRIRPLLEFEGPLALPETPQGWPEAIDRALAPVANSPEARRRRQAIARRYDWDVLALRIAHRFAARLGSARAAAGLEQALASMAEPEGALGRA